MGCRTTWATSSFCTEEYFKKNFGTEVGAPHALVFAEPIYQSKTIFNPPSHLGGTGTYSTYSTVIGSRYRAARDSDFRRAAAIALLCEGQGEKAFLHALDILLEFNFDRHPSDPKARLIFEHMQELLGSWVRLSKRAEHSREYRAVLAMLLEQVIFNEDRITQAVPLELTESMAKLPLNQSSLTELFEDLFEEGTFEQLSYLLHPIIAEYLRQAWAERDSLTATRPVQLHQLKDIERQLQSIAGEQISFLSFLFHPETSQGRIQVVNEKAVIFLPDYRQRFMEALYRKVRKAAPAPVREMKQKLQSGLLALLTDYDLLRHSNSAGLFVARELILSAVERLCENLDEEIVVREIGRNSRHQPETANASAETLAAISRNQKLSYSPSALAQLTTYDPVLFSVAQTLKNLPAVRDVNERLAMQAYLQSGTSVALVTFLFASPFAFRACLSQLKYLRADPDVVLLLEDLVGTTTLTEEQFVRMETIRRNLINDILAAQFLNLSQGQQASLFAMALLDETGLVGVTPRSLSARDALDAAHYSPAHLYLAFSQEHNELKQISKASMVAPEKVGAAIAQSAFSSLRVRTGLTSAVRSVLVNRLFGTDDDVADRSEQIAFLAFLSRRVSPEDTESRNRLQKYLFLPLTQSKLQRTLADHLGFKALELLSREENISSLQVRRKESEVRKHYLEFNESEKIASLARQKLALRLVDMGRSFRSNSYRSIMERATIELLLQRVFETAAFNPGCLQYAQVSAKVLLDPADMEQSLGDLFRELDVSREEAKILLKGFKLLSAALNPQQIEEIRKLTASTHFSKGQNLLRLIRRLALYEQALSGIERAVLRYPDEEVFPGVLSKAQRELELFASRFGISSLAKEIQASAQEHARKAESQFQDALCKLQGKLRYDAVTHTFIVDESTRLNQETLDLLRPLKDVSIDIEPLHRHYAFTGVLALDDWMQTKRFEYGYGEISGNDEPYLPLNAQTAVKVFREADGVYKYSFASVASVREVLAVEEKLLVQKRKAYLEAQSDFASASHAAKSYFLNVARINSLTSQELSLDAAYNEMIAQLHKLGLAGHITDRQGYSGIERRKDHRALVSDLVTKESEAIDTYISKVEVIHDLTFLIASLPAGPASQWAGKIVGGAVRGSRYGLIAEELLTTAKAVRAYEAAQVATSASLKTAGAFTGIAAGVEGASLVAEHYFGQGPRFIREKLQSYHRGEAWRRYPARPKVSEFAQLNDYQKAIFEYELEEALDPDLDGIPNNHPAWKQSINGRLTPEDLTWNQVERFAQNWKFFQGLNLSKAAIPRAGLVGEMAAASLWSKFYPADFGRYERVEQLRQKSEIESTGTTRARGFAEIALREGIGGAAEGLRFELAGVPTRYLVTRPLARRMPRTAIGAGTTAFVVSDSATKYVYHSIVDKGGHFENPLNDPQWIRSLADASATGSYIGYGIAKQAVFLEGK